MTLKTRDKYEDIEEEQITDDLAECENIESMEEVAEILRYRFEKDEVFTSIFTNVLLFINPFTDLSIYTESYMESYASAGSYLAEKYPPHVFEMAEKAYQALFDENREASPQVIIATGESASGKTFQVSQMMRYLCYRSCPDPELADRINAAQAVLNAFGSARTIVNPFGSRYGAYFQLEYDEEGLLCGANVQVHYLESKRIHKVPANESNYLVFNSLVASLQDEELKEIGIDRETLFEYVPNAFEEVTFDLDQIRQELLTLGVGYDLQENIFDLLMAIVLLGNVNLAKDMSVDEYNQQFIKVICLLLGVSYDTIHDYLVYGSDSQEEAIMARDALATGLYRATFFHLIQLINNSIRSHDQPWMSISLYDAPGFENLTENNLEQMCINFMDEAVHNFVNQIVFVEEQIEYENDGLPWEPIEFLDNSHCVTLLAGVDFGNLESLAVAPSDANSLVGLLNALVMDRYNLGEPSRALMDRLMPLDREQEVIFTNDELEHVFCVRHFAGDSTYDATEFIADNALPCEYRFDALFADSRNDFLKNAMNLSNRLDEMDSMDPTKPASTVSRFYQPFQSVMRQLGSSNPWFLVCLKSNDDLEPLLLDENCLKNQLDYLNIRECVHMKSKGYPYRFSFVEFFYEYNLILLTKQNITARMAKGRTDKYKTRTDLQPKCVDIIERASSQISGSLRYQIGIHHLYLSAQAKIMLDYIIMERKDFWATELQRVWRGYSKRKKLAKVASLSMSRVDNAVLVIQRCVKSFLFRRKIDKLNNMTRADKNELRRDLQSDSSNNKSAWDALSVKLTLDKTLDRAALKKAQDDPRVNELVGWLQSVLGLGFKMKSERDIYEFVDKLSDGKWLLKVAVNLFPIEEPDTFVNSGSSARDRISLFLDACETFGYSENGRLFEPSDLSITGNHERLIEGLTTLKEEADRQLEASRVSIIPVDVTHLDKLKEERRDAIIAFIKAEELYVDALNVISDFKKYLAKRKVVLGPAELRILFGNIDEILDFHQHYIFERLRVPFRRIDHRASVQNELDELLVGGLFNSFMQADDDNTPCMETIYARYFENSKASRMFIDNRKRSGVLKSYLDTFVNSAEMGAGTSLETFLMKPIDRIIEYLRDFKIIDSKTPSSHLDKAHLSAAMAKFQVMNNSAEEKREIIQEIARQSSEASAAQKEKSLDVTNGDYYESDIPEMQSNVRLSAQKSEPRSPMELTGKTLWKANDEKKPSKLLQAMFIDPNSLLVDTRRFICKGAVWEVINSNLVKERSLFLFSDLLIIAKEGRDETDANRRKFLIKTLIDISSVTLKTERNEDPHEIMMQSPSLKKAVYRFETDPTRGITYLIDKGILNATPVSVALFLYRTTELNKRQLGKFLGAADNHQILVAFLECFDFIKMRLDEALRVFLQSFKLPGDPRIIDSILNAFARRFHETNPGSIVNSELALKLTFAILMLNADLHRKDEGNGTKKLSMDEFIEKFRQYDVRDEIAKEMLEEIYSSVAIEKIGIALEEEEEQNNIQVSFSQMPFRVTIREYSHPVTVTIPHADPDFEIKIFPHSGLNCYPPVLTFSDTNTASFRIFGEVLGRKSISFLKCGKNAPKYACSSVQHGKAITVEPPFMKHVFQIKSKKRDSATKKRVSYMFSVADGNQKDNWCKYINSIIEHIEDGIPNENGVPVVEEQGQAIVNNFVIGQEGVHVVPSNTQLFS